MLVEFELDSLDGKIQVSATGCTMEKVTGDLQPVDWSKYTFTRNKVSKPWIST